MNRSLLFVCGLILVINTMNRAVFAEEGSGDSRSNSSGAVICVHPDDEKLKHMISLGSGCQQVPGHGGVWNQERTTLTVCASCHKEHEASSTLCTSTTATCKKKRPVADN